MSKYTTRKNKDNCTKLKTISSLILIPSIVHLRNNLKIQWGFGSFQNLRSWQSCLSLRDNFELPNHDEQTSDLLGMPFLLQCQDWNSTDHAKTKIKYTKIQSIHKINSSLFFLVRQKCTDKLNYDLTFVSCICCCFTKFFVLLLARTTSKLP